LNVTSYWPVLTLATIVTFGPLSSVAPPLSASTFAREIVGRPSIADLLEFAVEFAVLAVL
jgi:hypothetical protein